MANQTTLGDIADLLGVAPQLGAKRESAILRVSSLEDAALGSLVFATDETTFAAAIASSASCILAPVGLADAEAQDSRVLPVRDARLAFARVYSRWFDVRGGAGIHPTAVIEAGATLGEGCEIGPGCYLGEGVQLGARCVLGPRVSILAGTTLGARVRVQAGAVLGSDGFGYAHTVEGYIGFPQIGRLRIEDDVEIGANTTIDRGALGETRIGRGTKIDNLVHIAHNCRIGEHCILAAQVGMAGSCTIEDGAMLGGQVGLGEGVTIGRGVVLGGQGGVLPGKRLDGPGVIFWGTPAQPVRQYLRDVARMRRR